VNFDKLFSSVSTIPGALGLVAALGVAIAIIWAFKSGGFGGPDTALVDVIKGMISAQRENTKAVKENTTQVQKQLKQFEDSNKSIKAMGIPLGGIYDNTKEIAGQIHDELIRKEALR